MSTNIVKEVYTSGEVLQKRGDGAIKFNSANAGNLAKTLRGPDVTDLFNALEAVAGLASIANVAADDSLVHPSTTQLTVTATYDNAATRDVTAVSTYVSSDEEVATVSASGLVTTVGAGSVNITATYAGLTSVEAITVTE